MEAQVVKSYWDKKKEKYLHEGDIVEVNEERFKELSSKENESKEVLLKEIKKSEEVKPKAKSKVSEKSE